ncbi:MAG: hypothetical protein AAB855_04730 [Patescibacteria group bacterium]|mgnify:CR=1 FL=1
MTASHSEEQRPVDYKEMGKTLKDVLGDFNTSEEMTALLSARLKEDGSSTALRQEVTERLQDHGKETVNKALQLISYAAVALGDDMKKKS